MLDLALQNCKIVHNGTLVEASIGIKNGLIEKISRQKIPDARKALDCTDKIVLPGLIDAHVHFRTPGQEHKEDWVTASMAALSGGVTTVLDMPNNDPPTTSTQALGEKRRIVSQKAMVNFGFHFGAEKGNEKEILLAEKIKSVKIFTGSSTGSMLLESQKLIEKVFRIAKQKKLVVCVHAENQEILKKNEKRFHKYSNPMIHSKIRSEECESTEIERLLQIQAKVKNALYFCHVSSKKGVSLIREAKEDNENIFCEVTPHHLFLNEKSLEKLGNFAKVNPSIKGEKDRLALWKALKDGTIDVIASDHAPHLIQEKKQPYWLAPSGMPGTETMLLLLLDAVNKKQLGLDAVQKACSKKPAEIFGIHAKGEIKEGLDADFAVIDMKKTKTIKNPELFTKCKWSAFNARKIKGTVEKTIIGGKIVFDGKTFPEKILAKEVI